jgi:hypothetical protein
VGFEGGGAVTETTKWTRIANGLVKAICTPTNELAAKKGEDDLMVRIKRNSDRLEECDRHEFERQPNWRASPLYNQKIKCLRCGGEMRTHDAMTYIRGFAHGVGINHNQLVETIWPGECD